MFSKCWCKSNDNKFRCKCKCTCVIVWSYLTHLQYLVHKLEWRKKTNMTNMWTLLHTYVLLYTMTWHTCTLVEELTHLHCDIHNHMTSLRTYLHSHPHSYLHFANTCTYTFHIHTLADTRTHSHTSTY